LDSGGVDDAVHPTAEVDQRQGDSRFGEQVRKRGAGHAPRPASRQRIDGNEQLAIEVARKH
jgi:hypothetical protein